LLHTVLPPSCDAIRTAECE